MIIFSLSLPTNCFKGVWSIYPLSATKFAHIRENHEPFPPGLREVMVFLLPRPSSRFILPSSISGEGKGGGAGMLLDGSDCGLQIRTRGNSAQVRFLLPGGDSFFTLAEFVRSGRKPIFPSFFIICLDRQYDTFCGVRCML